MRNPLLFALICSSRAFGVDLFMQPLPVVSNIADDTQPLPFAVVSDIGDAEDTLFREFDRVASIVDGVFGSLPTLPYDEEASEPCQTNARIEKLERTVRAQCSALTQLEMKVEQIGCTLFMFVLLTGVLSALQCISMRRRSVAKTSYIVEPLSPPTGKIALTKSEQV